MLKLGMEICFGFKKCLNSRLYFSGLRLVIFSVYVINEFVFEFCFGLIGILLFFDYWINFIMIKKYLGKFIWLIILSLICKCLLYLG